MGYGAQNARVHLLNTALSTLHCTLSNISDHQVGHNANVYIIRVVLGFNGTWGQPPEKELDKVYSVFR